MLFVPLKEHKSFTGYDCVGRAFTLVLIDLIVIAILTLPGPSLDGGYVP